MFCENCGAPLDEGARFCENCGAPLEQAGPEQDSVPAGKFYYPNPARYTTHMGPRERAAILAADDADDFPENE